MKQNANHGHIDRREKVYERMFGRIEFLWHEKVDEDPHIDIYCFTPEQHGRGFYTLVTGGMSDRVMNVPAGAPYPYRRMELVFYCSELQPTYAEFLRRLAHFPFEQDTWYGQGHTMETVDISLLESGRADALLFLPATVSPDRSLPGELQIDGEPVGLLCVIPITADECRMIRTNKLSGRLLEVFEQCDRPYVFHP